MRVKVSEKESAEDCDNTSVRKCNHLHVKYDLFHFFRSLFKKSALLERENKQVLAKYLKRGRF